MAVVILKQLITTALDTMHPQQWSAIGQLSAPQETSEDHPLVIQPYPVQHPGAQQIAHPVPVLEVVISTLQTNLVPQDVGLAAVLVPVLDVHQVVPAAHLDLAADGVKKLALPMPRRQGILKESTTDSTKVIT
jgi:hypothetical protein